MWSPYKKQFGYIRETDLEGNAIIKLSQRVAMPLVFVGGLLIHPLYGGLTFQNRKIIVPNHGGLDSMRNLAWCVVDLYSGGTEIMYSEKGLVEKAEREYKFCDEDYLDGNGNFIMHGNLQEGEDTPSAGIYDYILDCGTLSGENANVIFYNNKKITKDDGIILRKYWLATYDKRARDWHKDAGNDYTEEKAIDIDDFFIVDGEKMLHPGDAMHGASGHNLYNCRCSIASKVIGFKKVR